MVNHPDSVTYDAFDCNSGKPHEPNTHWDPNTSAWEWDDLSLSSGSVPDSFPEEVKEALENNICIICGKKNCPYIKNNKDYKELIGALKKGNSGEARKIYMTKFAQRRGQSKGAVIQGLQAARDARKKDGKCGGSQSFQSRRVIATPGIWSEWTEITGGTGSEQRPLVQTINFNTSSNLESSFDVEIKYPESNGMKTINTIGPGSYQIKATGGGNSYIRVKSHSVPVTVTIDFPR
ncbi:hypothetical protein HLB02_23980 [Serratia nevei]|nr:hypothetical protein [Serratia nevei]